MSEKLHRRTSRGLAGVAVVVAAYYWILGGEYDLSDVAELRAARASKAAQVDSLRAVLDSVTIWADSLETDPRVIERVARERHSFIRPGESLYLFVEDEAAEDP